MPKQTAISKDETTIAYDKVGEGPVIIQVLGALNTRKTGAKLAKVLKSHFTVVSYDRRGRGDSTDTTPYIPEREVEDLAAVMEAIGEPVYLYGHSSGAAIVLEAARQLQKQIKKIAIYEAPYTITPEAGNAAKEYDEKLKNIAAKGDRDNTVALFLQHVGVTEKQIEAMKHLPMWKGLVAMAPTLVYDSEVLGKEHALPTAQLAKITTPTLVMDGGDSPEFMRNVAEALSKTIPHAKYHTLEDQTHGVKPEVLAPELVKFFG